MELNIRSCHNFFDKMSQSNKDEFDTTIMKIIAMYKELGNALHKAKFLANNSVSKKSINKALSKMNSKTIIQEMNLAIKSNSIFIEKTPENIFLAICKADSDEKSCVDSNILFHNITDNTDYLHADPKSYQKYIAYQCYANSCFNQKWSSYNIVILLLLDEDIHRYDPYVAVIETSVKVAKEALQSFDTVNDSYDELTKNASIAFENSCIALRTF